MVMIVILKAEIRSNVPDTHVLHNYVVIWRKPKSFSRDNEIN